MRQKPVSGPAPRRGRTSTHSGRAGDSKELKQMLSVRFDAPVLQATRVYAESKGLSISDVVRAALTDYLAENSPPEQWFAFPLSFTGYNQGSHIVCYGR